MSFGYYITFNISKDETKLIKQLETLAEKCDVIYEPDVRGGYVDFYVYDTDKYNQFIDNLKKIDLGRKVFLYKSKESEDYEWKDNGILNL